MMMTQTTDYLSDHSHHSFIFAWIDCVPFPFRCLHRSHMLQKIAHTPRAVDFVKTAPSFGCPKLPGRWIRLTGQ
jgi:hypothetical protein